MKQKLGETPEPGTTEARPKLESPVTPSTSEDILAASTIASAVEGETWDPNKQLEKLKTGVINRLREQQLKRSPTSTSVTPATASAVGEEVSKITVDDGTYP